MSGMPCMVLGSIGPAIEHSSRPRGLEIQRGCSEPGRVLGDQFRLGHKVGQDQEEPP